ncbi:hypothetical protein [Candidatus Avelusimicrobium sp.]|uniref:hypothetical protein n=1 Tax=Candidatus Avelusimicrobium sp. TaxID=3048833 RepID=UPI003D7E0AEB
MNIFKWLTGRAGKMALSAAQAVGLSAVVGVAGIAAWQYLDTPSDNTAFNPAAQYDPGEVVYVAGASGGSYGANGEVESAFRAKPSKAIEMTEKMTLAQKQAQAMEDDVIPSVSVSPTPSAYQMGATEGLGMNANDGKGERIDNNPLAAIQGTMNGMKDVISRAQEQAQAQANAQGEADKPGTPTLASAKRTSAGSSNAGHGQAFNSSFVIQDSGKSASSRAAAAAGSPAEVGNIFASAQAQANRTVEGMQMRSRANFGPGDNSLAGDKEVSVGDARSSKEGKDLVFIQKRSADAARNKNRSANEGSRAFLASTKVSGGMRIVGDTVAIGQGQGSKDFDNVHAANLRGIGSWTQSAVDEATQRMIDRQNLQKWLWKAIATCLAAMIAIPLLKKIPLWGTILAVAVMVAALAVAATAIVKGGQFAHKWGGSGMSTAVIIVGGLMAAGVAVSFILHNAFAKFYKLIGQKLGLSGASASSASGGAGGAAGGSQLAGSSAFQAGVPGAPPPIY